MPLLQCCMSNTAHIFVASTEPLLRRLWFHRTWCEKLVAVFFEYRDIKIFGIFPLRGLAFHCCPTQLEEAVPMSFLEFVHIGHVANNPCTVIVGREFIRSRLDPSLISTYSTFKLQVRSSFRKFHENSTTWWTYSSCNEGKESLWMPIVFYTTLRVAKEDLSHIKNKL